MLFIKNLFKKDKQLNTTIICSCCNNIIEFTDDMNNWKVLDKHYCGKCYAKMIINEIKSKYKL